MIKTLYLHIGCGKTGSSALQVWLNQNTESLSRLGILYPVFGQSIKDDYLITSGNGVHLVNAVKNGSTVQFLKNLHSSEYSCALFSSEAFQVLSEEEVRGLKSDAESVGFHVKPIAYVRNLYEMFFSSYMQLVKRHGMGSDIFTYAKNIKTFQQFDVVALWCRFFDNISILHYDTEKVNIGASFLRVIGQPEDALPTIKKNKVNRSLTMLEAKALKSINFNMTRKLGVDPTKLTTRMSDVLISNDPERKSDPVYYSSIVQDFKNRFGKVVEDFNRTHFSSNNALRIHSEGIILDMPEPREDFARIVEEVISAFFAEVSTLEFKR